MTTKELISRLKKRVAEEGYDKVAREYEISTAHFFHVVTGRKPMGKKILARLGWKRSEKLEPIS
jgi:hypothetical protein